MRVFDLTLAVTAHAETVVAGPAMRSAELAISAAEAEGFRVERLILLDTPTEATRSFFAQPVFEAWTTHEDAFADQGLARNELARLAAGRWIAFLDADDLLSENWLVAAASRLRAAERDRERVIVHPELNWIFDRSTSVLVKTSQDDPLFTPYYFYFANYYDALCVAPREVHVKLPYATRDVERGLAYEDWQWNVETMAAGWRHVILPDTIVFKRRQEGSQNIRASQRRALFRAIEPLAIDRVEQLGGRTRKRAQQTAREALEREKRMANAACPRAEVRTAVHTQEGGEAHRSASGHGLGERAGLKDDLRDVFISRVAAERTFADIGGLWGTVNEKVSVAHDAGASELAMIDVTPLGSRLWSVFDERMSSLELREVRTITGNIDDDAFVDSLGVFEVVHCSGVLYHCPSPIHTLANLRRVTRDYLILTSTVFPRHIEAPIGKISLEEGAQLFIPNLSKRSRAILAWHLETAGIAGVIGISQPVENWRVDDYAPWWWAFTQDALLQLVATAGFDVVDSGENWSGRSITVLARPRGG